MAWGVDDVDLHILVLDRAVLGKNGDAALALLIVGVEHALVNLLVLTEHAGGIQHAVDHRGLAVVDVGDNRDIANVLLLHGYSFMRFHSSWIWYHPTPVTPLP